MNGGGGLGGNLSNKYWGLGPTGESMPSLKRIANAQPQLILPYKKEDPVL